MLVQQPNDIGVETIEASDFVNDFLIRFHYSMIFKTLDFVK